MPVVSVPEASLDYYLIAFDQDGKERSESDGLMSQRVLDVLSQEPITDVFIISHGWLSDVPSAKNQYHDWLTAMANSHADIEKMGTLRPDGFKPLMIGLHWPSKPWGNETLEDTSGASISFELSDEPQMNEAAQASADDLISQYAQEVSNSDAARAALKTIFTFADEADASNLPETLPPEILEAYQTLIQDATTSNQDENTDAWDESEPLELDPERLYQASLEEEDGDVSFGIGDFIASARDTFLQVPRLLSFWKMKNLARQIGETSGFDLLKKLQSQATEQVRFHLIGHSFGTIVVSATLAGPKENNQLVRPVNSLTLLQGAVSLWSYAKNIPKRKNLSGYFHPIIADRKVVGPIITTQSQYDWAVGTAYPLAGTAGLFGGGDIDFGVDDEDSFPPVGGIGTYGIQGEGLDITDLYMLTVEGTYNFQPGHIYNLDSDEFIRNGRKDAHMAIGKPEVAHAVWSAVRVG